MNKILLSVLLIGITYSQQYEDVVYLKDGSIIHGIIIEQAPNKYIKIKSGKNVFVYQMDEIEKMTKEITDMEQLSMSDISQNTWSIGLGLGTNKSFNIVQLSKDIKLSKNFGLVIFTGFGVMFGLGITAQSDYNNNGIIFGWTGGIDIDERGWGSLSLAYQWRINKGNTFFSLGMTSVAYETKVYRYNYHSYDTTEYINGIMPVISFDYRF